MMKSLIYLLNSTLFCGFVVSVVSLPSCGFCEVLMNDQSGARHSSAERPDRFYGNKSARPTLHSTLHENREEERARAC